MDRLINEKKNEDTYLKVAYGQGVETTDAADYTVVDQIHKYNRRRINNCLKELKSVIMQKGKELLHCEPELHKLVHDKKFRDVKDLEYLLRTTKKYENPADFRRKILQDLRKQFGIADEEDTLEPPKLTKDEQKK